MKRASQAWLTAAIMNSAALGIHYLMSETDEDGDLLMSETDEDGLDKIARAITYLGTKVGELTEAQREANAMTFEIHGLAEKREKEHESDEIGSWDIPGRW